MYRVILRFHDAATMKLYQPGDMIEWPDTARIQSALDRGLIEEIKQAKEEPKPKKAPAKKKKK